MAVNDRDISIGGNKGIDLHPGVANPTAHSDNSNPMSSNFVDDPTTSDLGAGANSATFEGDRQARRTFAQSAGVVEGRPGLIESANIDPLNEHSNDDDGWANANANAPNPNPKSSSATSAASGTLASAATVASGAAKLAYGTAVGDEETKRAGREGVWGKQ